jgi:signal transduction histidine kinase
MTGVTGVTGVTRPNGDAGGAGPGGHGIAGMRERAEALGGRFRAGPEGDAFVVRAELPTGVVR